MPDILLDSDIVIAVLRGSQKIIDELIRLEKTGCRLLYTPIAKAEIYHGIRKGEEEKVEAFFAGCHCLPIADEAGEKAGYYLRRYHQSHGVEIADAFVAAAANINDAVLFTLNHKHYPMKDVAIHRFSA